MTERKRKSIKNIENRENRENREIAAPEVNAMNAASAAIMENAASVLNEARIHSPQLEHIMLTLIWAGERAGHCGNCGRTEKEEQMKEAESPASDCEPEVTESAADVNENAEGLAPDIELDTAESTVPDCEPEVIDSTADVNDTTESTEPDTEPETEPENTIEENTIEMEEYRRRRNKRNQYWSHNRTYWLRGAEAKLEKVFPMCSIASRQEFICKLQLVPGLLEYCCAAIYDHFGSEPFSMIMAAQEAQSEENLQNEAMINAGSSDDAANALSSEAAGASSSADASAARREEGSR